MAEYINRDAYIRYLSSRKAEFVDDYGKGWSAGINTAIRACEKFPAADVASVRPELRKAVDLLHKNYEKALNSSYVRNPIAWALYHTWKKMDKNNRRRCQ